MPKRPVIAIGIPLMLVDAAVDALHTVAAGGGPVAAFAVVAVARSESDEGGQEEEEGARG